MSYLQPFLKSYFRLIPQIQILSSTVQSRNNLIVNYPLVLQKTKSSRLAMMSEGLIKKNNDLLLLAAGQCFFSSGFAGSLQAQQMQINSLLSKLSEEYEVMNKEFNQKMKIYIQVIANLQKISSGSMPVRDFAEYIINSPSNGLQKQKINSRYLQALYQHWENSNKITFSYMKKDLLKRVEEQEFINTCNKGRCFIRNAGESSFLFAAPFIDKIDHSYTPNCEFQMLYFPHRRSPFIRIRTLRDIVPGERPTINYGKLNNYQLLMRYGFSLKNNPYSVFMLPLNFQNIIQVFNKNIEWKQKQLMSRKMRLKNYVKILPTGKLDNQDLTMMRILICDGQNPKQGRITSQQFDHLIHKYISQHAISMRNNIKINSLKKSQDENIKILEDEEIQILDKYITIHKV